MKVKTNSFAHRHTPGSGYSYFKFNVSSNVSQKPWEILEHILESKIPEATESVLSISLDPFIAIGEDYFEFYSAVKKVTSETKLTALFEKRRKGEDPYVKVVSEGEQSANFVNIILYSHAHLGKEAETDADYEIISINCCLDKDEPPTPIAMARNFLDLPGGTKTEYTAEQFAKSILYWSTHVLGK